MSSPNKTANGLFPMCLFAHNIACPRPSCSFCLMKCMSARPEIFFIDSRISFSPFSSRKFSSSTDLSKWSSIVLLFRPVMIMMSSMPDAAASSTTNWIVGLSMIGSISFGCAFVAGRKRVPNPAAGITAFVIFFIATNISLLYSLLKNSILFCLQLWGFH